MRLEFLPSGSTDCPLIRLFEFTPTEAQELREAVADLAAGRVERILVHALPGVEAVNGCELVLCRRAWDQSIAQVGPMSFECGFTVGTWENVAGLIEPFTIGGDGYQWLAGIPGEAFMLLSPSGHW